MRIALDSSVLIAAHISRAGVCSELLEDVLSHHELVTSEFILDELARKLIEKFKFPKRDVSEVTAFLRSASAVVSPAELSASTCRDPTDVPVLGTAISGECALLVSVNRDLLDMKNINGIPIIRPGEYWRCAAALE